MCPYVPEGNKTLHSPGSKSAKPELLYISEAGNFTTVLANLFKKIPVCLFK